ncbi:MAG TPA: DUF3047 domain-containing protein [Nitrospira sp.]|nr:DUF3047 domain-containing protein [Nitrospira sp.]
MSGLRWALGCLACGLLAFGWLFAVSASTNDSPAVLEIGSFSGSPPGLVLPDGWKPLTFKKIPKPTAYQLVKDGAAVVVKATSDAAASGLTKEVRIDASVFSVVQWRWKVDNLLTRSDVTRKSGDDYPARLYITFEYDAEKVSLGRRLKYKAGRALFGDIPIAALNYIWDSKTPVGTIVDNAYTDFAKMIVVESGPANVGTWVEESRNVYQDYKQAFGEEPPLINGIAIMTDTDNTRERATAYYGDIRFVRNGR